ncbi:uncharacterized protein L969DRAFT_50379 [Mixia osmundae IAM 14324]|uniref:Uncharacterized protein n=1 Tax=Mixia osmundae (strain CBS 9802 / IAM 14324 / JCM 22182 / KY 12970) TaxID=764103 RepID=G7E760_MIXOS|nr:uncharacterized protein L969DRAFT_50379 [Mixia osmundae IAM 14324]KEI38944.1 hypothetical protein L969DRAFT_50379 [Mixia osmundae IAM 14324]GAA98670.1 hypothetical protein E5Q_05358 [Mixia osmundae IAM 14324]
MMLAILCSLWAFCAAVSAKQSAYVVLTSPSSDAPAIYTIWMNSGEDLPASIGTLTTACKSINVEFKCSTDGYNGMIVDLKGNELQAPSGSGLGCSLVPFHAAKCQLSGSSDDAQM